jgi:hypothetical protein
LLLPFQHTTNRQRSMWPPQVEPSLLRFITWFSTGDADKFSNLSGSQDFSFVPKASEVQDFIRFARTEGRFAKHFDKNGNPGETLLRAKQKRLDNWHTLQELTGTI